MPPIGVFEIDEFVQMLRIHGKFSGDDCKGCDHKSKARNESPSQTYVTECASDMHRFVRILRRAHTGAKIEVSPRDRLEAAGAPFFAGQDFQARGPPARENGFTELVRQPFLTHLRCQSCVIVLDGNKLMAHGTLDAL